MKKTSKLLIASIAILSLQCGSIFAAPKYTKCDKNPHSVNTQGTNKPTLEPLCKLKDESDKKFCEDQLDSKLVKDIAIINFKKCVELSNVGREETAKLEDLRNNITKTLAKIEASIEEVGKKLDDQDYLGGLSKEGVENLQKKWQQLNQEYSSNQSMFYQKFNRASANMVQSVKLIAEEAANNIKKSKGFKFIFDSEALFFFPKENDITPYVIQEMNLIFDCKQSKNVEVKP